MRHPNILLIIFLLNSMCSFAQSNFIDGYYISNEQDTVFGLIDDRGESRNGKLCTFKDTETSESVSFLPGEIAAYRIIDGKYYVSREVNIDDNEEIVFLEFLVDGIKDLYFYPGRYYIEDNFGDLYQLIYDETIVSINDREYIRESKKYIGQLMYLYSDCPPLYEAINDSDLSHKSLINLATDYHNEMCDGEACIVYQKPVPIVRCEIGLLAGIKKTSLDMSLSPNYKNINFRSSNDPVFGTLAYFYLPRVSERFALSIGVEYFESYYYGYAKEELPYTDFILHTEIHGHLNTGSFTGSLRYAFTYKKIRPVVEAGFMIIQNFHSDFRHVEEKQTSDIISTTEYYTHPLLDENVGFFLKGGASISLSEKNRVSFLLRYDRSNDYYIFSARDGMVLEVSYLHLVSK